MEVKSGFSTISTLKLWFRPITFSEALIAVLTWTVYANTCVTCHGPGVAGAPKLGDKDAWAPRIKLGKDALYKSALKGKKSMPPKGGHFSIPDDDVKLAVDYMVTNAQ